MFKIKQLFKDWISKLIFKWFFKPHIKAIPELAANNVTFKKDYTTVNSIFQCFEDFIKVQDETLPLGLSAVFECSFQDMYASIEMKYYNKAFISVDVWNTRDRNHGYFTFYYENSHTTTDFGKLVSTSDREAVLELLKSDSVNKLKESIIETAAFIRRIEHDNN